MLVAGAEQYVTPHVAAKILSLSPRRVQAMCELRVFKTAHKPGYGKRAHWKILRTEVVAHKFDGHVGLVSSEKK